MARRRRNKRYRRGRLTVLLRFFSFVLICAAIVTALILFFRVETVEITGNQRYTTEEVVEVTGIQEGDNLFLLNKYAIADQITGQLPYVQSVRFWRELPDTIVIEITECQAVAAVVQSEEAWLVSQGGKLLERVPAEQASGYLQITGVTLLLPTEGSTMELPEDGNISEEQLLSLLTVLSERNMLAEASQIDCSDEEALVMRYAGRFDVQIPYDADFNKKLYALQQIIDTLQDNETGTVILTLPDRSFFKPDSN